MMFSLTSTILLKFLPKMIFRLFYHVKAIHHIESTTIMEHFHSRIFLPLFFYIMVLPSSDGNYYPLTLEF
jgi:hypothetical protein